jgi:hypothetical protein
LKISLLKACTVLIFFIAGLLLMCLEHVFHRELIASRWRPAFSSHLVNAEIVHLKFWNLTWPVSRLSGLVATVLQGITNDDEYGFIAADER